MKIVRPKLREDYIEYIIGIKIKFYIYSKTVFTRGFLFFRL